jgi:hypothetical protein
MSGAQREQGHSPASFLRLAQSRSGIRNAKCLILAGEICPDRLPERCARLAQTHIARTSSTAREIWVVVQFKLHHYRNLEVDGGRERQQQKQTSRERQREGNVREWFPRLNLYISASL